MAHTIRNEAAANEMLASTVKAPSAYDRIGRNALAHGPIRTYPAKPSMAQRIARALTAWL